MDTAKQDAALTLEEQATLLRLARAVLREHTLTGKVRKELLRDFEFTETLRKKAGVFVTLHCRGALRGCIGYIEEREPLYQAVKENTVNAACRDPRFPPVEESELDTIHISLSVLSPPEEVSGPSSFEVGRHGIILRKGCASAVFLPQVAPEQGWDREETLHHLSRKAGLNANAWKEKDARFWVFTAQVFHEQEEKKHS